MKTINIEVDNRNPVVILLDRMGRGDKFEACNIPQTEQKWYINEDGEYVRYDG